MHACLSIIDKEKTTLFGLERVTAKQLHKAIQKGEIKLGGSFQKFERAIELAMANKDLSKKKIAFRWLRETK